MDDLLYIVIGLVALITTVYIIKKVASCLIKTIVFILLLAALCAGYYLLMVSS